MRLAGVLPPRDGPDSSDVEWLARQTARCGSLEAQVAADREQLQQQLATKDAQLEAKDRQIEELLKRPRTVNNTTNNRPAPGARPRPARSGVAERDADTNP